MAGRETGNGFPLNDTFNTCPSKEKCTEKETIETTKAVLKALHAECVSPTCWYILRKNGDWDTVEYQALTEIYKEESLKNN